MAILTQGTEIYVLAPTTADPDIFEVMRVACPTAFSPGDETAEDIDATCLDVRDVRTVMAGLITPGEASMTINTDPSMASHLRLYALKQDKRLLKWAVGWSDGTAAPTLAVGGDDFVLPATRTWVVFEGTLATFPFSFETNSVVQSGMTIKRSGAMVWTPKAP